MQINFLKKKNVEEEEEGERKEKVPNGHKISSLHRLSNFIRFLENIINWYSLGARENVEKKY